MISSLLFCFLTESGVTSFLKPGSDILDEVNDWVRSLAGYLFQMFEGNSALQLKFAH